MTTVRSQDSTCRQFHQLSGESAAVSPAAVTGGRAPPSSVILGPDEETSPEPQCCSGSGPGPALQTLRGPAPPGSPTCLAFPSCWAGWVKQGRELSCPSLLLPGL